MDGWIPFLPFGEEKTEEIGEEVGSRERGETGKEQDGERRCRLKVDWEVSNVPGKPGSDSSWATHQLCDLDGSLPDLSRPLFHHLQNGNNNIYLRGLLWDEMKRCAYSALSWPLGWDHTGGFSSFPSPRVNTSIVAERPHLPPLQLC